jgi:hypothetical protein
MGNTLCKPVVQPPINLQTNLILGENKKSEPLLTDEAIKELIVSQEVTDAAVNKVDENVSLKEESKEDEPVAVIEEPKVEETKAEEPKAEEPKAEEPKAEETVVVIEETVVVIEEPKAAEEHVTTVTEETVEDINDKMTIIQPIDETMSCSSNEEHDQALLKKKRGRKKKTGN